jgi:short-subunit dehydrogenase
MEHYEDSLNVTLICPGFIQTNVAKNAITGEGSKQNKESDATKNEMPVTVIVKKFVNAIKSNKFDVYIGGKEVLGVYWKRFFPKLLHFFVL